MKFFSLLAMLFLLLHCIEQVKAQPLFGLSKVDPLLLYEKRKRAVLKIEIYERGEFKLAGAGTGTIVSADGLIITNFHVANALFSPAYQIAIKTFDGTTLSQLELLACSDKREMDLCLLKTSDRVSAWFPVTGEKLSLGHEVYKIGHGGGEDYNLTAGQVVAREDNIPFLINWMSDKNRNVEFFEVSALLRPGDSGGPVYNSQGNLVGISTMSVRKLVMGAPNRYMVISANEVYRYLERFKGKHGNSIALLSLQEIRDLTLQALKKYAPPEKIPLVKNIQWDELKRLQGKADAKVVVLDVRDPFLYTLKHYPGAINITYHENSKRSRDFLMAQDEFDLKRVLQLVRPQDLLVVYCDGDNSWLSYKALEFIRRQSELENLYWIRN
ncbi:MAG: trypsin-like peptidase domain-containing protein [Oligoflexia bacterium]|nr:trypsin-like peptidase domain-containing protein [Oligoflexia bacterium]MBF0365659.1 trypsin-like peptidase domain-containing protein [Oligoflexia bacterium]